MAGEYIEFNNNAQPAVNDTNLNRLQQLIKQDIQGAVSGDTLPVGAIMPFGSDTIPENWLLCNGQAVSRTDYQQLFNTIGTSFGQGDGFTTFNLPNYKDKFTIGKDNDNTDFNTLGSTNAKVEYETTTPSNDYITGIVQNYIIKAKQTAGVVAQVIDGLTSTSATDALSAKQGKVLNEKIEGEVIYNNTAGANDNIVLSKNVSNFTRLKIFYATSIGSYFIRESKEFLVTDGCDVSLSILTAHSASLQINTLGRYHISGTSINKVFETATRFGSANDYSWEGNTSRILISKVIGY
jgi:microcystin-dependent protein